MTSTDSPTTAATGTAEPEVTADQITEIAQEVWESFLSMSLLPHPLGADLSLIHI